MHPETDIGELSKRLAALEQDVAMLKDRDDIGFVRQLRMMGQIGELLKDWSNIQADLRWLRVKGKESRFADEA